MQVIMTYKKSYLKSNTLYELNIAYWMTFDANTLEQVNVGLHL